MASPHSILADWGTTRLRLYLNRPSASGEPCVLGTVSGPGVKFAGDFDRAFLDCAAQLPAHSVDADVIIAGMAGSNIGWRETGYLPCPTDWQAYVAGGLSFASGDYRVTILPGVSYASPFGYRDIMRGEEVQVLGALRSQAVDRGRHLFCLPGTHTKWLLVDDGLVYKFVTTMQGELFDMLQNHSVLVPRPVFDGTREALIAEQPFMDGVALLRDNGALGAAQALFSVRCRYVSGEFGSDDTVSYLSGIIVATDVRDVGARLLAEHAIDSPVIVIGDAGLAEFYSQALSAFGIGARLLDATDCTVRGLAACLQLRAQETHGEA